MKVLAQLKWHFVIFTIALLTTLNLKEAFAQETKTSDSPFSAVGAIDTGNRKKSVVEAFPVIDLAPRIFDHNFAGFAFNKMTLPKNSHVKVAVVVYAVVGTKVNITRYCQSEVKKVNKDGVITTATSATDSTDVKVVGKTGVLLSWRQLQPSANGECTLTVEVGGTKETFTVYGEK